MRKYCKANGSAEALSLRIPGAKGSRIQVENQKIKA
jgi:hypothetical protein